MVFLNPWKKYNLKDFDSVIIPLDQAQRHHSVIAENQRRASMRTLVEEEKDAEKKPSIDKTSGDKGSRSDGSATTTTIESLCAEIDADISASGHDSTYDRKSKVINKALIDIGMGKYQWELFVLCGFGWFADNLCAYLFPENCRKTNQIRTANCCHHFALSV